MGGGGVVPSLFSCKKGSVEKSRKREKEGSFISSLSFWKMEKRRRRGRGRSNNRGGGRKNEKASFTITTVEESWAFFHFPVTVDCLLAASLVSFFVFFLSSQTESPPLSVSAPSHTSSSVFPLFPYPSLPPTPPPNPTSRAGPISGEKKEGEGVKFPPLSL